MLSSTHHLTRPLHTPYPTYMYMCDLPTCHQYTHISDFRIAIQLTCSQHILHRYIHSHATHVFIGWVQEICKLFHISRTVSIGINGLWKVRRHHSNNSFCLSYREKGRGRRKRRDQREGKGRERGRRGKQGGVIRYVTSKLAAILMHQG